MMHRDKGSLRMNSIIEQLDDIARVEVPPRFAGRRQTMMLAPDKVKINKYLQAKSAKQKSEEQQETSETPTTSQ
jgi:hypothetical protein